MTRKQALSLAVNLISRNFKQSEVKFLQVVEDGDRVKMCKIEITTLNTDKHQVVFVVSLKESKGNKKTIEVEIKTKFTEDGICNYLFDMKHKRLITETSESEASQHNA